MKTIEVELAGTFPLLVHRFIVDVADLDEAPNVKVKTKQAGYLSPREEAEYHAYILEDGTHAINAFAVVGAIRTAGATYKQTGSRKSVKGMVATAFKVRSEFLTLLNEHYEPIRLCEVDSRRVVIPATRGSIVRHRARYNNWRLKFEMELDDDNIDVGLARLLLRDAGKKCGIGDFRPEKMGPFGTFDLVSLKEVEIDQAA